jgi:hypothetical protein
LPPGGGPIGTGPTGRLRPGPRPGGGSTSVPVPDSDCREKFQMRLTPW